MATPIFATDRRAGHERVRRKLPRVDQDENISLIQMTCSCANDTVRGGAMAYACGSLRLLLQSRKERVDGFVNLIHHIAAHLRFQLLVSGFKVSTNLRYQINAGRCQ